MGENIVRREDIDRNDAIPMPKISNGTFFSENSESAHGHCLKSYKVIQITNDSVERWWQKYAIACIL
jgi:hypothetical protein